MSSISSIKSFAKKFKFIVSSIFFLGLLLIFIPAALEDIFPEILASIVTHFGVALMVASVIGFILELTEIKDFFEKRLIEILKGNEFLNLLDISQLKELNKKSMKTMIQKNVNNPYYDCETLPQLITDDILSNIGVVYYEAFHETIEHAILSHDEIKELFPSEILFEKDVVRLSMNTKYQIVSPRESEEIDHKLEYSWYVKMLPGINKNSHYQLKLTIDGKKIDIVSDDYVNSKDSLVSLDFTHTIKVKKTALVEWEIVMYEYGEIGHLPATIDNLTHNLSVHFSSLQPLELSAEIYGMTTNYFDPSITKNSVVIRYPGWLLPGQGYYILWEKI